MAKKVRCISPHGGSHNGMYHDGTPVSALPDGTIPRPDPGKLRLPPNPGGYVADTRLGHCAVGQVYDVPDDFYADGFHWEDVTPPEAPPPPPPPAPAAPAAKAEGK